MVGRVQALGTRVRLSGPHEAELPLTDEVRHQWHRWSDDYRGAVDASPAAAQAAIARIGAEMFAWLDTGGWAQAWLTQIGSRQLEIVAGVPETADDVALLDLPWEVLSDAAGHLAAPSVQSFEVWRRVGPAAPVLAAEHRDLSLLFMAASPEGAGAELDFEREEAAILRATAKLPLALAVEESGCADILAERLAGQERFEAIHLSCHGTVLDTEHAARIPNAQPGPTLLVETPEGEPDLVSATRLARVWGEVPPRLAFISACRTSEAPDGSEDSFARALTRAVPTVVAWAGSVYDRDAATFAERFYRGLAGFQSPGFAAAAARTEALTEHLADPGSGRHWHLARLWLGSGGGGPLCDRQKPRRRLVRDAGVQEFLDKSGSRVPVAGPDTFVGRRRDVQKALTAFRHDAAIGVLVHGMGNLGKSSLAARVANRLPMLTTVVVFEHYDPLRVLDQIIKALPAADRKTVTDTWRPIVDADPSELANAVEHLLDEPLFDHPILLIVDDLERILEAPGPSQPLPAVLDDNGWRSCILALLSAFGRNRGGSRLLFTSRFDFTAVDPAGRDAARDLARIPLAPFADTQRKKQWQAKAAASESPVLEGSQAARAAELLGAALDVAHGNPGLQDVLTQPLLDGELDAVEQAIADINAFLARQEGAQASSIVIDFLRRMAFQTYADALSSDEKLALQAVCVFGEGVWPLDVDRDVVEALDLGVVPVPESAAVAVARARGVAHPVDAVTRLRVLGLLDTYAIGGEDGVREPSMLVNALARPMAAPLDDSRRKHMASAGVGELTAVWAKARGSWPLDSRALEACRIALLAGHAETAQSAALATLNYLYDGSGRRVDSSAALAVGIASVALAKASNVALDLTLLMRLAEVARRLGKGDVQRELLAEQVEDPVADPRARAQFDAARAELMAAESPLEALQLFRNSVGVFERLGDVRSRAVTMGQIADVLQSRGDVDEALRIRREEELPVYERLGDVRSRAVTMGQIADVLQSRGDTDEALRIRREEQLPVFERLGDVRSRAVTMGQIADVLQSRGDVDEALRIRREEQLPVYERLGDVRSLSVCHSAIGQALLAQGGEESEEEGLAALMHGYDLAVKHDIVDGVANVGLRLGYELAKRGSFAPAVAMLNAAHDAFGRLGAIDDAAVCLKLLAQIDDVRSPPG